jgi:hypothetical protein
MQLPPESLLHDSSKYFPVAEVLAEQRPFPESPNFIFPSEPFENEKTKQELGFVPKMTQYCELFPVAANMFFPTRVWLKLTEFLSLGFGPLEHENKKKITGAIASKTIIITSE